MSSILESYIQYKLAEGDEGEAPDGGFLSKVRETAGKAGKKVSEGGQKAWEHVKRHPKAYGAAAAAVPLTVGGYYLLRRRKKKNEKSASYSVSALDVTLSL